MAGAGNDGEGCDVCLEHGSGGPNLLFGWVIPVLLMDGMWSGRMMPVEVSTTYGSASSAVGGRSMVVAVVLLFG